MSPGWAPHGQQLAFASDRGGSVQVYVMDRDGGNQRRLIMGFSYSDSPDWSPRGDRVAYALSPAYRRRFVANAATAGISPQARHAAVGEAGRNLDLDLLAGRQMDTARTALCGFLQRDGDGPGGGHHRRPQGERVGADGGDDEGLQAGMQDGAARRQRVGG